MDFIAGVIIGCFAYFFAQVIYKKYKK